MMKQIAIWMVLFLAGCGTTVQTQKSDLPQESVPEQKRDTPQMSEDILEDSSIITAGDNQQVLEGKPVTLSASTLDKTKTFTKFIWKEGDTVLAQTQEFQLENLQNGLHKIVLEAVASDGTYYRDVVQIVVKKPEPENTLPLAKDLYFVTPEDTSFVGALRGSDSDGNALRYVVVSLPKHGVLSGSAAHLHYMPDPDFYGEDYFYFKTNDGTIDSDLATVRITVEPRNDAPVAKEMHLKTDQEHPVTVTFEATDKEGDALFYYIVKQPAHGTLDISGTRLVYTPQNGFSGMDSFVYKANDGTDDSLSATVFVQVDPVNHPPLLIDKTLQVNEDGTLQVTLQAQDSDGDAVTYRLASTPVLGSVQISGDILSYQPYPQQSGIERLTIIASDGQIDALPATFTITILPQNDVPLVSDISISTNEDNAKEIRLQASDVEDDDVTFTIVDLPQHGSVVLNGNKVIYTPEPYYHGSDSFTYKANDGKDDSAIAVVSIDVISVNNLPQVADVSFSTLQNKEVNITLYATDIDEDALTFYHETPSHGTINGSGANLVYRPDPDFTGTDTFLYWVNDTHADSQKHRVTIDVTTIANSAPIAEDQTVTLEEDTFKTFTLQASDAEETTLDFAIQSQPLHGSIVQNGNSIQYTPSANYHGTDSLTFTANDGSLDSNLATVSFTVNAVNDKPEAISQAVTLLEDSNQTITLSGTDVDGDSLQNFTVSSLPSHGTVICNDAQCVYTPQKNFYGVDSFAFTVSDGSLTSEPSVVMLNVNAQNDAPVAISDTQTLPEDQMLSMTLQATDAENDTLVFTIVSNPQHGNVTLSGNSVVYTPKSNYHGTDSFTFKATDETMDSNTAQITLNIAAVNDAPVADPKSLSLEEDSSKAVVLSGSDIDGDTLTYMLTSNPSHGMLSGTAPNLTYTPDADYYGSDSFTYVVKDDTNTSDKATVSITVNSVNDIPLANAGDDILVSEGVMVVLDGSMSSDSDGTIAAYEWKEGEVVLGTNVQLFKDDFSEGVHTITLTVVDNNGAIATDTITVTIVHSNFIAHHVTSHASSSEWLEMVDLDRDGDLDIISASSGDGGAEIAWYKNNADNTYIESVITSNTDNTKSIRAADMDGDRDIDIVYTTHTPNASLVLCANDGTENFTCDPVSGATDSLSFIQIVNQNAHEDSMPDIITASCDNNKVEWLQNEGGNNFSTPYLVDNTDTNLAIAVATADFNKDGNADIVAAYSSSRIDWYAYHTDGTFVPHWVANVADVKSIVVADLNQDGYDDIISVSNTDNKIYWHKSTQSADPTFEAAVTIASVVNVNYASVADMDNDGDLDILSNTSQTDGKIVWYENIDNAASFEEHIVAIGVDNVVKVFAADMDNDGNMDIISSDISGNITVYENNAPDLAAMLPKTNVISDGNFGAQASFSKDEANEMVIDHVTGLMWADDASTNANAAYWSDAKDVCQDMNKGGYTDWRIPSVHELYYLLDRSALGIKINTIFNHIALDGEYWVNENASWSKYGWVDFSAAGSTIGSFSLSSLLTKHIRCVRGATMQFNFTRDHAQKVILDTAHNLMWDDSLAAANTSDTWVNAKMYCKDLTTAGYNDWRLPNINELFSVAVISEVDLSFNTTFENTSASKYWSSTPKGAAEMYVLDFGGTYDDLSIGKESIANVRCVRNIQ